MMKIKFRTENGADLAPTFGERRAVALAAGQWDIGQRPMPLNPMRLTRTTTNLLLA
jgi:hypothetical protein